MHSINEDELEELNLAKKAYIDAEYGTDEYFQAFIIWHNTSFKLSKKIAKEAVMTLFPFSMKGYEIGLKDLAGEIALAKKFLANKKKLLTN